MNTLNFDVNSCLKILGVKSIHPWQVAMFTILAGGGRISTMSRRGWPSLGRPMTTFTHTEKKQKQKDGSSEPMAILENDNQQQP